MSSIASGTTTTTGLVYTSDTTGNLVLQTNGTTTAMAINTSQQVGIGTSNPGYTLDAQTSGTGSYIANFQNTGTNQYGLIRVTGTSRGGEIDFYNGSTAQAGISGNSGALNFYINGVSTTGMTLDNNGNLQIGSTGGTAKINAFVANNASYQPAAVFSNSTNADFIINIKTSSTQIGPSTATPLAFAVGNSEIGRFDSSGNLLIGTTTTNGRLTLKQSTLGFDGGFTTARSDLANVWGLVTGGDSKFYIGYATSGTPAAVGNFATNGTYTATSDIRKKKDISYEFNGLEFVTALKPAMGRMLDDDNDHPLRPFFIAQDVQTVLPSLVSSLEPDQTVQNPILGVDYASVAPVLVKAIQELSAKVTALEAKVG